MNGPYQTYQVLQIDFCWNIFVLKLAMWLVGYITGLEMFNGTYKAVTLVTKWVTSNIWRLSFPINSQKNLFAIFHLKKKRNSNAPTAIFVA